MGPYHPAYIIIRDFINFSTLFISKMNLLPGESISVTSAVGLGSKLEAYNNDLQEGRAKFMSKAWGSVPGQSTNILCMSKSVFLCVSSSNCILEILVLPFLARNLWKILISLSHSMENPAGWNPPDFENKAILGLVITSMKDCLVIPGTDTSQGAVVVNTWWILSHRDWMGGRTSSDPFFTSELSGWNKSKGRSHSAAIAGLDLKALKYLRTNVLALP